MDKVFKIERDKVYKVVPDASRLMGFEIHDLEIAVYDESLWVNKRELIENFPASFFYFKAQSDSDTARVWMRPIGSSWQVYVVKVGGDVIARLYNVAGGSVAAGTPWYEVIPQDAPEFLFFAQEINSSLTGSGPEYLVSKKAVRMNFPIYGAPLEIGGFHVVAMADFPTDKVKELPADAVGTSEDAISYWISTDQHRDNAPNWIGWTNRTGLPISQIDESRLPEGAKEEIAKVHSHEWYYVLGSPTLMPNGMPIIFTDPIYIDEAFKDGSQDKSQGIYDIMMFQESIVDSLVLYVVEDKGREPLPGEVKRSVLKRFY